MCAVVVGEEPTGRDRDFSGQDESNEQGCLSEDQRAHNEVHERCRNGLEVVDDRLHHSCSLSDFAGDARHLIHVAR